MRIMFDREEMARALGLICRVLPSRSPRAVLESALFRSSATGAGCGIEILATDLDVGMWCRVRAKVEGDPINVCLPAPAMLAEMRESVEKTGVIEIASASEATLRLGRDIFELAVADAAEFPDVPARSASGGTKLPAADWIGMVRRCIFAAGRKEARYAINGVFMNVGAEGIEMAATDGKRLAVARKKGKMKGWPAGVIIPTRVLAELQRAIRMETGGGSEEGAGNAEEKEEEKKEKKATEAEKEIEIEVRDNTILFSVSGVTYSSTFIAGNFPRYENIIPKSSNYKITFVRRELESALRKALHFVNREVMTVRFEFESKLCTIRAQDYKTGSAKVTTDIECEGNPQSPVAFNPQFLLDVVGVLEEDKVTIEFSGADRPAVIKEGQDYVYVVMPQLI